MSTQQPLDSPTSAASKVDECTFDCPFGNTETDSALSQQKPFARLTFQFDDCSSQEEDKRVDNRKRKLDKDDFVAPTQPNYLKVSTKGNISPFDIASGGGLTQPAIEPSRDLTFKASNICQDQDQELEAAGQGSSESKIKSILPELGKCESQKQSYFECISDLLEGLAQETKMSLLQFSDNFRESELFETQCLHEVEALLAKALAQEENLLRQKNFLHDRLSILSQRLQQYNS